MKPEVANLMIILDSSVTYNALQVDADRQCLSSFFSWNKDPTFKGGIFTKKTNIFLHFQISIVFITGYGELVTDLILAKFEIHALALCIYNAPDLSRT